MALAKINQVTGSAIHVPGDDIDTDRIIPARFMKCITFDGLGEYFFYDVRKTEDGQDKPHNLNDPRFKDASIIISGNNFGCGSSREHAPWALQDHGFEVIISTRFDANAHSASLRNAAGLAGREQARASRTVSK